MTNWTPPSAGYKMDGQRIYISAAFGFTHTTERRRNSRSVDLLFCSSASVYKQTVADYIFCITNVPCEFWCLSTVLTGTSGTFNFYSILWTTDIRDYQTFYVSRHNNYGINEINVDFNSLSKTAGTCSGLESKGLELWCGQDCNPPSVAPLIRTQLHKCICEIHSMFPLKKKVKDFVDTAVVYSKMDLIRNLKHLWFITKRSFSIPFPSVPHISSRLCYSEALQLSTSTS
jgi:hypothetical protein